MSYPLTRQELELLAFDWELSMMSKLFNDNGLAFAILNCSPERHLSVPGKLMGTGTLMITHWCEPFTNERE